MHKKANIQDVANFVVHHLIQNQIGVNHLKLQKLLYYIQSWHMVYFEGERIFDEAPEAWVNGPVYRDIYNRYKGYGAYPYLTIADQHKEKGKEFYENAKLVLDLDEEQWKFLDSILLHYGTMTHEKLVMLTHSEKPWNKAREGLGPFDYSENKIDLDLMHSYYKDRLAEKKAE